MGRLEFFEFFYYSPLGYFISLILVAFCYYIIISKINCNILNPISIALISAALADAIPLYLFIEDFITDSDFIYFISFEILFITGLLTFKNSWKNKITYYAIRLDGNTRTIFNSFFILYVILSIIKFKILGIPLFMEESRLGLFQGSGGLGIISRILPILNIYCILYCFIKLIKKNYYYILPFLLLLISNALDGSKSYIITFVLCFFYIYPKIIKTKQLIILFFMLLIVMFLTQLISFQGDLSKALITTGGRFVANGDIYYNLLPYKTYQNFSIDSPFNMLYKQIFAPFHLTTYPENIGYEIGNLLNYSGENTGPNLRPSVLCLIMFGKGGGLLIGYVYGLLLSFLIRFVYKIRKSNNLIIISLSFYTLIVICTGITGILDFLGQIFDLIIAWTILLFTNNIVKLLSNGSNFSILSTSISPNTRK